VLLLPNIEGGDGDELIIKQDQSGRDVVGDYWLSSVGVESLSIVLSVGVI